MKYQLAIVILLILALSGCGTKTTETKAEDKSVVDEEETSDSIEPDTSATLENDANAELEEHFSKAAALQIGEEVQADKIVNFSFDEGYWCKEIRPENIEGSYSYIKESEGYWYLVLKGSMENLQENKIDFATTMIGDITPYIAVVKYGDQNYLAKFTTATEENDSITPLLEAQTKATVYLIANIPEAEKGKGSSATALIGFSDLQDTICGGVGGLRIDWDKCQYLYTLDFDVSKEK